jgi:hypothetical protein
VDNDSAPSEERRREMLRLLNIAIRRANASLREQQQEARRTGREAGSREDDRRDPPPYAKKMLDSSRDFIGAGKSGLEAAALAQKQRERAIAEHWASIYNMKMPSGKDIEFPEYWAKLKEIRKDPFELKLTKAERNLIRAMNSTLSVNFDRTTFRNAIDYLQEKTGTTIVLDKEALEEAEVSYDDPVSFSASKIQYRTVLRKLLADRGLTYFMRDGVIEVVTPKKARETMVTRLYPLPVDPLAGPLAAQVRAQQIIQLIVTTIEPASWAINGGSGTIAYDPLTRSLIITNHAELITRFLGR